MKKIAIPICEDTIMNSMMSIMLLLMIGVFGIIEVTLLNEGWISLLIIPLFVMQFMFVFFILMVWDKEDGLAELMGKINPFSLRCNT